jgi:hypothetical protein
LAIPGPIPWIRSRSALSAFPALAAALSALSAFPALAAALSALSAFPALAAALSALSTLALSAWSAVFSSSCDHPKK